MGISETGMMPIGSKSTPDANLKSKIATSGFWKTAQNGHIPSIMGISGTEMMPIGRKSTQKAILKDENFRFLETSPKFPNTIHYGYFRNRNDAQMPKIDPRCHFEIQDGDFRFHENNLKWLNITHHGYFRNRNDAQRQQIDPRCHFEIQDYDFQFLENSILLLGFAAL